MTIRQSISAGRAGWVPAVGAAAAMAGTAAWVEHRSRKAERAHPPPGHYIHIDGTRLHYVRRGEGPPVLLIHGNLVDGADFAASGVLDALAASHRVLVIDRPGFGHSDRPRGRLWTPAEQARVLHRAAAALGMHRPVVVAHSIGAQIAVAMALQEAAEVTGLVLIGGYYYPGLRLDALMAAPGAMPILGDVMRYGIGSLLARVTLGRAVRAMFAPQPVPEAFDAAMPRALLLRPLQQRAIAEDGTQLVPQARALRKRYTLLRMPVTLIVGAEDRIVDPRAQSERLHHELPQSRLHLVPGAGHMVHYQAMDLIGQAVDASLARSAELHPRGAQPASNVVPLRTSAEG